jgi:hypothetical protein
MQTSVTVRQMRSVTHVELAEFPFEANAHDNPVDLDTADDKT